MKQKKILKTLINNSIIYDINSIKDRIKNFEFVSFDIFDTLIKRDVVNIDDVFSIIEKKYNNLYINDLIYDFKNKRINSEKKALKNNPDLEEITINDIYNSMSDFNEEKKSKIKKIECEVEIELSTQHKPMYELYQWCIQNRKKIIIISDMYLDINTIKKILDKNGYSEYYKLYLSSEIRLKKSTGNLFRYVLEDLGIKPNQLIHIGDNIKSDFIQAKRNKIQSILIPTYINYRKFKIKDKLGGIEKENYKLIKTFINNRVNPKWDIYFSFGYEILGPILVGFSYWLYNNLKNERYNKVFFFSRDGYMMKKAFDQLFPNASVETKYLYVSRRSIRIPLISKHPSFENVTELVIGKKYFDLNYFFANIGLDINIYKKYFTSLKIDPNRLITKEEFLTNPIYKNLFYILQKDLIKMSESELVNLTGYLRQEGFYGDVAIVDIGWKGSIQNYLSRLYPDLNIKGYYIGLNSSAYNKENMYGYLFYPKRKDDFQSELFKSFLGFFEILFLALEGSTEKFVYDGKKYEPILREYELANDPENLRKIQDIQLGSLKFIEDVNKSNLNIHIFTKEAVYNDLLIIGRKPKNKHVELFGDFIFYDSKVSYFARPKNFLNYVFNVKQLKKDFLDSAWKIGFLKRLLKLYLPYDKIYDFLKKRY